MAKEMASIILLRGETTYICDKMKIKRYSPGAVARIAYILLQIGLTCLVLLRANTY